MLTLAPFFALIAAFTLFCGVSHAIPHPVSLATRQTDQPVFPDQPPSCPICAQNYANIDGCAEAAPVLANVSMILFNPGAFIDVIKCACTDTFQSVYPQCVDCFEKTNQTSFLNTTDTSGVIKGIQSICSLASTLVGGAPSADGEIPSTGSAVPAPTSTVANDAIHMRALPAVVYFLLVAVVSIAVAASDI